MTLTPIFQQAKDAALSVAAMTDGERNDVLLDLAAAIEAHTEFLLEANRADLARMDSASPLYDRLLLTPDRLLAIASDMRHVATLPSPLGIELERRTLPNGLLLRRETVPFGVVGVVYEARPNVSFDVFSLCLKSGNACVLKGGSDADDSNRAIITLIHSVLEAHSLPQAAATLLPATHEATAQMLGATGYIDVCIPRGGKRLIEFVRDTARIPVIETGAMPQAIALLREKGITCLAAALYQSQPLSAAKAGYPGGVCVVIGSEGQGLTDETIAACTSTVRIPMTDRVESLNAGIAGSILLWHFREESL